MSEELIYKIERIEKMLYILLNDEQKEEIRQFDIEHWDSKLNELEKRKHIDPDSLQRELKNAIYTSIGVTDSLENVR